MAQGARESIVFARFTQFVELRPVSDELMQLSRLNKLNKPGHPPHSHP